LNNSTRAGQTMIKNYFKIAFRNITRHKAYSLINISGLAIGMACSILILLWVQHELSYDRFHKNADNIFRITCNASDFKAAVNTAAMPAGLKSELPAVKNFVRLSHQTTILFEVGDKKFEEKNTFYADSTFLEIFSFPLIAGNPATVFARPDAVVLTQSMAKKYFGKQQAIGKTLKRNNRDYVTVTGIFADIPANSHLQFDFLMPMSAIAKTDRDLKENTWGNFNFYTYLLLDKSVVTGTPAIKKFEKQMDAIYKTKQPGFKINFQLQPLKSIHLHSNLQVDLPGHGNIQYVNIFLIVAIFILVVACINFMNLATARSARRAREVGIRKVAGAKRGQLIQQFMGESLVISFLALLIAIGLVFIFLPLFNNITGKRLGIDVMDGKIWLALAGMAVTTGLVSGSYPALFLSSFRPVKVLKGSLNKSGGSLFFRNALVVTQFIVSIVLLIGTVVVYKQLNFIHNRNIGFEKENLLYMPMTGEMWGKIDAMKAALKQNPLTTDFTIINDLPTNLTSGTIDVVWDGKDPKSQVVFPTLAISDGFIDVFKMHLLKGRAFSESFRGDSSNYLVNETALRVMGMKTDEAVGKSLSMWGNKGVIIGVVKDFNFKPVQQSIEPLVLNLNTWGGFVMLRTSPGNSEATIKALRRINTDLNPAYPFTFNFLDQDIANLYQGEKRLGTLFNIFAVLAILISCMGLYGLSAFLAEQRRREIGVRKVLGASVFGIMYLLSTGFTKLILLSILIAIPLSWYSINSWLESFAYHIDINWLIFLVASVLALAIAWLTVSYESLKAAVSNPVRSLRSE
jgi:putative ABC transport system permease protein